MSALLAPLGALYGAIAARRMRRSGQRVRATVVCIGNLTLGGAGKTPSAIATARLLRDAGAKPAFLTRGYGGRLAGPVSVAPDHTAADVGDEPLLLARVAPTVVAHDRVAGAAAAIAGGFDTIVMDDGFQNPSLEKNLSVLVIDGRRGIGNGRVFPAGPLRAPLAAQLDRAHALLVIGEPGWSARSVISAVRRGPASIVVTGRLVPDPAAVAALAQAPVLAFAGIADPEKFFATLRDAGIAVAATRRFADHHHFDVAEAKDLIAQAEQSRLTLVTTEKDLARMTGDPALAELAARVKTLPVAVEFDNAGALRDILESLFF